MGQQGCSSHQGRPHPKLLVPSTLSESLNRPQTATAPATQLRNWEPKGCWVRSSGSARPLRRRPWLPHGPLPPPRPRSLHLLQPRPLPHPRPWRLPLPVPVPGACTFCSPGPLPGPGLGSCTPPGCRSDGEGQGTGLAVLCRCLPHLPGEPEPLCRSSSPGTWAEASTCSLLSQPRTSQRLGAGAGQAVCTGHPRPLQWQTCDRGPQTCPACQGKPQDRHPRQRSWVTRPGPTEDRHEGTGELAEPQVHRGSWTPTSHLLSTPPHPPPTPAGSTV